ncbi:MAG TPA: hypothetical protein VKX17_22560 [Planctomycetota bacterium]|nr:hypothetical protein [Planctomycetota bacterium]
MLRQPTPAAADPAGEHLFCRLAAIWPKLPEHLRAAIMALAGTVKP